MTSVDPEVQALRERVQAAKINMSAVLRDAGVDLSTWTRWCNGSVEPKVGTFRSVREAAERHLGRSNRSAA